MTEPLTPSTPPLPPAAAPGSGPLRPGSAARSRSSAGRARAFRQKQERHRSARREVVQDLVVVVVIVLGVFAILTARPGGAPNDYVPPSPGPAIAVHLGSPSVTSVSCGNGESAYAERIPWTNSTQPVTTGDVNLRVYEIWDGDYYGDPGAVANVTSSNVCAGAAPSDTARWYAVLTGPNGTNLLTYTQAHPWVPVTPGPWDFEVENSSAIVLVSSALLVGSGRGLAVFGFADGAPVLGAVVL